MRNWNQEGERTKWGTTKVCILPMRNWNLVDRPFMASARMSLYFTYEELKRCTIWADPLADLCLYFTYEELKPESSVDKAAAGKDVCILPMRNWNSGRTEYWDTEKKFVFYLWGIETEIEQKVEEQITLFVFYLWGIETLRRNNGSRAWRNVCTLPMRN